MEEKELEVLKSVICVTVISAIKGIADKSDYEMKWEHRIRNIEVLTERWRFIEKQLNKLRKYPIEDKNSNTIANEQKIQEAQGE